MEAEREAKGSPDITLSHPIIFQAKERELSALLGRQTSPGLCLTPNKTQGPLPAGTQDEVPEESLTAWEGGGWARPPTALRGRKPFL